MSVVFTAGETIGEGDLDIYLTNAQGNPANAYSITYAIYFVEPSPPYTEVLIGPDGRVPVNPIVGTYYASLIVPPGATVGDYRIRWTFQQFAGSPAQQVVQEWAVVAAGTVTGPSVYSQNVQGMIDKLRLLLRDQCVGGEETVEIELSPGGERMIVTMEELWAAVGGMQLSPTGIENS